MSCTLETISNYIQTAHAGWMLPASGAHNFSFQKKESSFRSAAFLSFNPNKSSSHNLRSFYGDSKPMLSRDDCSFISKQHHNSKAQGKSRCLIVSKCLWSVTQAVRSSVVYIPNKPQQNRQDFSLCLSLKSISVKLQHLSVIHSFLSAAQLVEKDNAAFLMFGQLENRDWAPWKKQKTEQWKKPDSPKTSMPSMEPLRNMRESAYLTSMAKTYLQ